MLEIPKLAKVDLVFGNVEHMPKEEDVPKEFWRANNTWSKLAETIFFRGSKGISAVPKEGVDPGDAIKAVGSVLASFKPSHEHKIAACGFMLSEWFHSWSKEEEKENE